MNKIVKLFAIVLVVMMVVAVSTPVFASDPGNLLNDLNNRVEGENVEMGSFMQIAAKVIKAIRNFAIIASVIILVVIGIKYMMGSVEQKSDYQKSLIPLIIGIILVVGATSFASLFFSIMGN